MRIADFADFMGKFYQIWYIIQFCLQGFAGKVLVSCPPINWRTHVKRKIMKLDFWKQPVFSAILANRTETLAIVGAGALQIGLHLAGLPGWACPFKQLTGIPCPGCGLTTATGQLVHAEFGASLRTHAFAPIFVAAFLLMVIVIVLPKDLSQRLVSAIAQVERTSGATAWVLTALMVYWIVRLWGQI